MKLPRRVPWTSITELDQVCAAIYTDENDLEAKVFAIQRLSAWKAITSLPHALESTLALLVVIVQDASYAQQDRSFLCVRQSYASAIIRLVNGLVDPLQLGVYARSIAAIAGQLGLPLWLVELRHAATHEDLPSLELLREGARQSMSWLLSNYWLPTLNPSTAPQVETVPLRPLNPILKKYKNLLKVTIRDASLRNQYKQSIQNAFKDLEKWIAESKVAANVEFGELGWSTGHQADSADVDEQDAKDRWALEFLCDTLLEKGGLIPLSKKKRVFPVDSFSPPEASLQIWTPLLDHIQSSHPVFSNILLSRTFLLLLNRSSISNPNGNQEDSLVYDPSYEMCLARWAWWIVDKWNAGDDSDGDMRTDAVASLFTALGPGSEHSTQSRKTLNALLHALCSSDANLEAMLSVLQLPDRTYSANWTVEDIAIMNQRLNALLAMSSSPAEEQPSIVQDNITPAPAVAALGWRTLDASTGWKPCPIGVHCDNTYCC